MVPILHHAATHLEAVSNNTPARGNENLDNSGFEDYGYLIYVFVAVFIGILWCLGCAYKIDGFSLLQYTKDKYRQWQKLEVREILKNAQLRCRNARIQNLCSLGIEQCSHMYCCEEWRRNKEFKENPQVFRRLESGALVLITPQTENLAPIGGLSISHAERQTEITIPYTRMRDSPMSDDGDDANSLASVSNVMTEETVIFERISAANFAMRSNYSSMARTNLLPEDEIQSCCGQYAVRIKGLIVSSDKHHSQAANYHSKTSTHQSSNVDF